MCILLPPPISGDVKARKQEIIEYGYLDSVASRIDICAALKEQRHIGHYKMDEESYGGTRVAIISCLSKQRLN